MYKTISLALKFYYLIPFLFYLRVLCQIGCVLKLGPRELTGAVDLISHYKLLPHHEFFCKRSLPLSISNSHYLHNVVGDTELRKGEGMQLDQLTQDTSFLRETNVPIQPFDLDVLREAFQFREMIPVVLPPVRNLLLLRLKLNSELLIQHVKSFLHCDFNFHILGS